MSLRTRRLRWAAAVAIVIVIAVAAEGYRQGLADPVIKRLAWHVAGWPKRASPVRLVLVSDLHVAEPDRPPARLARIVDQINALKPDCVLIAGDMVSDRLLSSRHIPFDEALAPLAKLRPKIASFAVLGNHDHWRNADDARRTLRRHGVRVLTNEAVRCDALAIGGIDDPHTRHADVASTEGALKRIGGYPVLFAHSPDIFPEVRRTLLVLAGHTHCGQISLPVIGPPAIPSNYGKRYACGVIRESGRTLVVTAGIGTSVIPIRWNVAPDIWLIDIGG